MYLSLEEVCLKGELITIHNYGWINIGFKLKFVI